jgi:hypothetical protein
MYKFFSNLILKNNGGKLIIKSIQTLVKYFFKYLAKLLGKVLFEEMWKYSRPAILNLGYAYPQGYMSRLQGVRKI